MFYILLTKTQASRGSRGRDRMVVGFTTTYATSAYYTTDAARDIFGFYRDFIMQCRPKLIIIQYI